MADDSPTAADPQDGERPLDDLGAEAFQTLVATLRRKHRVAEDVPVDREVFDSEEDLNDYLVHAEGGEIVSGMIAGPMPVPQRPSGRTIGSSSTAGRAAIARALARKNSPAVSPTSRTGHAALAREMNRKAATRAPRRASPDGRTTKPARPRQTSKPASPPRLSRLVQPGIYHGPPIRFITAAHLPREVDVTVAKFRRQSVGVGKCTGAKLDVVTRAFSNAYFLVESARQEVIAIRRSPDAMILWHGSLEYEQASLAYWFGAGYSAQQMGRMLVKIEAILTEWSLAFCGGFRGLRPVWIRCKSRNGTGGGPARHLVANMIELFPRYFGMSHDLQWVTMLHEMGHRSTRITTPRDERHDLCDGGWNTKENMCYRITDHAVPDPMARNIARRDGLFFEGNPRVLAVHAEGRNNSARATALNNIDNYVCYMWNRQRDRSGSTMQVLRPGVKPSAARRPDPSWNKPPN